MYTLSAEPLPDTLHSMIHRTIHTCALLGLAACAQPKEADTAAAKVVGTYSARIDLEFANNDMQRQAFRQMKPTTCEIRADGTFVMKMPGTSREYTGPWSMQSESLRLTATEADGSSGTLVGTVDGDRITLTNEGPRKTMRLLLDRTQRQN